MLLPVGAVDIRLDSPGKAVGDVGRQRLVAVAAQDTDEVQQPCSVGFVVAEQCQEPAQRSETGPVLLPGPYPAGKHLQ